MVEIVPRVQVHVSTQNCVGKVPWQMSSTTLTNEHKKGPALTSIIAIDYIESNDL